MSPSTARERWTLDPRDNSLNLIRLGLAGTVLVSHSFPLSGAEEPMWAGKTPGSWAVIGFFALSGYLITGSRLRSDGARYFMNRVARILPGYLACLVVIAFVFAPVAYVVEHGGIDGFLTTPNTPMNYVFGNALLEVQDHSVAGTLAGVPHPYSWNGSLWSLYFEFLCYVVIGVAAIVPVVRRRPWPIVAMFAVSVLLHAQMPTLSAYLGGSWDFTVLVGLLPYFLGGAAVFVVKERCPLRWYVALPALGVALVAVTWQLTWGAQLVAPLFAYSLLWLASVVPSPQLVQTHDLSYGVYVYAWPVTQLLVLLGAGDHPRVLLLSEIASLTLVLALLSWLLVERPAKDLVTRRPTPGRERAAQPAVPQPAVPQAVVPQQPVLAPAPREAAGTPGRAVPTGSLVTRMPSDTREQLLTRKVPAAI